MSEPRPGDVFVRGNITRTVRQVDEFIVATETHEMPRLGRVVTREVLCYPRQWRQWAAKARLIESTSDR